eukprot:3008490-Rhodomonas_salina.2
MPAAIGKGLEKGPGHGAPRRRPKGKNASWRTASQQKEQTDMRSFSSTQCDPVSRFERTHEQLREAAG